jgi:hypothetical protein
VTARLFFVRAAAFTLALVAGNFVPVPGFAGTIGFRTDAEVKTGPGIDAKVTMTHTGDEAASSVMVRAEFGDKGIDGARLDSVAPGKSEVWNFHVADAVAPGVYAMALRARYTDANGYPFEIVSIANATAGVTPAPKIFGSVDIPGLAPGATASGRLVAKRPPGRSGTYDVRLVVPSGLEVTPETLHLEFDDTGRTTMNFTVRNKKLLAGTFVNVFAFVTGTDPGFPQTDVIRGTVRISAAKTKVSAPQFYRFGFGVYALLVLLEAAYWIRSRRAARA